MSDSELEEYEVQLSDVEESDDYGIQNVKKNKKSSNVTLNIIDDDNDGYIENDNNDDDNNDDDENSDDIDSDEDDLEIDDDDNIPENEDDLIDEEPESTLSLNQKGGKTPSLTDAPTQIQDEVLKNIIQQDNTDDEDDEDDDDEDYLKKFDEQIRNDYILNYHPEIKQSNNDEITALAKVIKDEKGNIIDPFHKTIPILTKFERTRVLGMRAKQINSGAEPFIKVPQNIIEGYVISEMELNAKALPYIIVRPIPGGKKEYWYLEDLEVIDY